jgi:hypothetical protein
MTHAQSARAFTIYIAKREYKSWQREYLIAKRDLNRYAGPVTRSVGWQIFNHARDRYLKSMARLRAALKVTA